MVELFDEMRDRYPFARGVAERLKGEQPEPELELIAVRPRPKGRKVS